jgi:hypothetical protein
MRRAPPGGLEPPTCCLEGSCSIQLSYGGSPAGYVAIYPCHGSPWPHKRDPEVDGPATLRARGERSSAGRAPGCGPGGRRFESGRSPLRPWKSARFDAADQPGCLSNLRSTVGRQMLRSARKSQFFDSDRDRLVLADFGASAQVDYARDARGHNEGALTSAGGPKIASSTPARAPPVRRGSRRRPRSRGHTLRRRIARMRR